MNTNSRPMPKLFVKQKGAGNGKTYDAVQLINDEDDYETKLYLTKAHSAVHVIMQEFEDQLEEDKLDISVIKREEKSKKHDIKYYFKKNNSKKRIIIATIDSFIWSIAIKTEVNSVDKFKAWIDDVIEQIIIDKNIAFTSEGLFLEKTLIIGDEMQDLSEDYMEALLKVTKDTGADMYIVGDKLQSISIPHNAFTMICDLEIPSDSTKINGTTKFIRDGVDICIYDSINESNRFESLYNIRFLNHLIPFEKFGLPEIEMAPYKAGPFTDDPNDLCVFSGNCIYADETDEIIISGEAEGVMKHYIKEVEENDRYPNDFIFITPFTNKNPLMDTICLKIREYWESRFPEEETYKEYCIFHKSEDGKSIDLSESDEYTRCVSIHSSKGDGRSVAFMIGFTEKALMVYSCEKNNLIYESLLHVGSTRFKQKLYIRVECNNDDIHTRIYEFLEKNNPSQNRLPPSIDVRKVLKLNKIIKYDNLDNYKVLYENIIQNTEYDNYDIDSGSDSPSEKRIIDIKHHKIRYSSLMVLSILLVYGKTDNDMRKDQFKILFYKVIECDIIHVNTSERYLKFLNSIKKDNVLPILDYSNKKGDYKKYHLFLKNKIEFIQKFMEDFINRNDSDMIYKLEWIDTIILYFMIRIIDEGKYSDITINDIYDIIHIYHKTQDSDIDEEYKNKHYHQIEYLSEIWDNIFKKYPDMRFLYDHHINYTKDSSEYKIYNIINILGYNGTDLVLFKLKPQFTSLNYSEVLIESIYNHHLIRNTPKQENNYDRFNGKNIYTCILSLDHEEPYYIKWQDNIDYIQGNLYENTYKYYKSQINYITIFYKFYHDLYKTSPNKMIDEMSKSFNKLNKKNIPNFIIEYYSDLKCLYGRLNDKPSKIKYLNDKYDSIKQDLEIKIEDELKVFFFPQKNTYDDY